MNRFLSPKFLVTAALATAALGAATVAEARPDVYLSIGFQNGAAWVEPAPLYVRPPVYLRPAPVIVRAPVFVAPREVFERPGWRGRDVRFERERAWRHAEWRRHERHEQFRGGDRDHGRDDRKGHH